MIKFLITHPETGRKIFGMVLTEGNINYLKNGKPIHINCEQLNLPYFKFQEMLVMYYPSNEEAVRDLTEKGYIDKNTVIEELQRPKVQ